MAPDKLNAKLDLGTDSIRIDEGQDLSVFNEQNNVKKENLTLRTNLKLKNEQETLDIVPKRVKRLYGSGESRKIENTDSGQIEDRSDRDLEEKEKVISVQASTDKSWFKKSFKPDLEYFKAARCLINAEKIGALDATTLKWYKNFEGSKGALTLMVKMFDALGSSIDVNSKEYKQEYKKFVNNLSDWHLRSDKGVFNFLLAFKRAANVYKPLWDLDDDSTSLENLTMREGALQLTNGEAREAVLLVDVSEKTGAGSGSDSGSDTGSTKGDDKKEDAESGEVDDSANDDEKSVVVEGSGDVPVDVGITAQLKDYLENNEIENVDYFIDDVRKINDLLAKYNESLVGSSLANLYIELKDALTANFQSENDDFKVFYLSNDPLAMKFRKLNNQIVEKVLGDSSRVLALTDMYAGLNSAFLDYGYQLMTPLGSIDLVMPEDSNFDENYFLNLEFLSKDEKVFVLERMIKCCDYEINNPPLTVPSDTTSSYDHVVFFEKRKEKYLEMLNKLNSK